MVVIHLAPFHRFGYRIGFPSGGDWREAFNSDVYESWVNPGVVGNGGHVIAHPQPMHGFAFSAALVLPANSLLIFTR
jgi:1,4-alpha-glucan branching enzyme